MEGEGGEGRFGTGIVTGLSMMSRLWFVVEDGDVRSGGVGRAVRLGLGLERVGTT